MVLLLLFCILYRFGVFDLCIEVIFRSGIVLVSLVVILFLILFVVVGLIVIKFMSRLVFSMIFFIYFLVDIFLFS